MNEIPIPTLEIMGTHWSCIIITLKVLRLKKLLAPKTVPSAASALSHSQ